jgi:hypothetical protein
MTRTRAPRRPFPLSVSPLVIARHDSHAFFVVGCWLRGLSGPIRTIDSVSHRYGDAFLPSLIGDHYLITSLTWPIHFNQAIINQ